MGFSPELDGFNDFASCPTTIVQDVNTVSRIRDSLVFDSHGLPVPVFI